MVGRTQRWLIDCMMHISLRLHQCLGHDIHRKWSYLDKIGSNLNNSAGRIENGGSLSRWYNDDYTRLRKLICLYMLHTHMLHDVSRFSGSAVFKGIKKNWFRSLRWTFTHASLPLGLLDFSRFSGLAVSEVIKKKKQNKKKRSLLPMAANLLKTSCDQ